MNFEKVELYGFKSFADKAEIKFGNGITGIVGPNGCGKSNVADAIRWVLGEQSAKSLRGSSMQDVIFSGTQNRKSLSYCEVSLFFDNSNKMFSLDYNEVIITRKLYRSGESEYFINKQPARLKDIVELLHECGIGKEGYSIIGQGKVEEIMSAKPEDRRLIFEEATGIAKFKTRKVESERKLERTHENLVRYIDILTEIENQLGPLEKQAEKAKEFNELSEELKYHELNTYIAKVDGVATAKAKINEKIKGITEQADLRQSEMEKAQKDYDTIFSDISNADNTLRNLNNELLEKRVGMEQSTSAKQLFEAKINNLEEQIVRSENEIEKDREIIANAIKTKEDNQNLINESNKLLEELTKKYQDLEKRIKVINEKITLGEEIAQESRKRIIESIENLSDFKVSKGTFSAEKQKLTEKVDELNAELDALSIKRDNQFNEKEKIDKKIDELDRSIFELKNKITAKEDEVRSGNDNVSGVENKIFSLNTTITALETKEHFYKGLKENYDGYGMVVKSLMIKSKDNPELKKRIKGVVAELIKIDKKFDVAIETALSASAQNVVTANEDDAKYLINYLKVNKLGRITFLPITSVRPRNTVDSIVLALREEGALGIANEIVSYDNQYENIISNLLGNTLVVDNLDNATAIAKRYHFDFRIVTLDGDLLSNQGAMTGGSRRFDAPSLLSNDRKIEEISAELKVKRVEMEKLQKDKETLSRKSDAYYEELSVLNDLYTNKRQELSVEREKQMSTEKILSEIGRDIETTSYLIEDFNAKLLKASEVFEHIAKGGEKLEESKNSATLDADKKQAEYDALRQERDNLNNECTEIQINITEIKGKISSTISDNERLSNEAQESEKNIKHLEESIDGAKAIIEGFKKEEEKVALTKEEQDYVNGIRDKISKIDEDKEKLRERLSLIEKKREELNNELTELSEKKHAQEIALTEIDSDLKHMGESILEDYQETYETALAFKAENYDEKFGVSEINRIRKKRSALGAINANAIDECKVLRERYDEMTTQKDDLEKAEKDLNEAIDKIKGEMLVQFDEGFNKINENFQKIFKELFGGGRAMLQMDYTEVDDKLEAGVEIVAEPPGKKLQKLSLLSGGEKALTAIAILFAILRLRPMPFCVLDEIEAALDEANVDRFARYLQKFSEETQFIVITHRKPTMEMADALFGVTMQEKGVSKTVSVKLSDISEFDGDAV